MTIEEAIEILTANRRGGGATVGAG